MRQWGSYRCGFERACKERWTVLKYGSGTLKERCADVVWDLGVSCEQIFHRLITD